MVCPHCGGVIPKKESNGNGAEAKFRQDVKKAEAAIAILERQPYPELTDACADEMLRLAVATTIPKKLYAIYRRADTKTPIAYGMRTLPIYRG